MRKIDADELREALKESYEEAKLIRDVTEGEFRDFAEGKMIALLEVIMKIDKAPTVDACSNADV
jgi:hypothetical protein